MDQLDSPSLKGKERKPKRFLGKNDTLQLATAIASDQEKKSLRKAERIHHFHSSQPQSQKPRLSTSKARLKETKALLAAQRSQMKNEKAKLRKGRPQEALSSDDASHEPVNSTTKPKASGKRVSFA